MQHKASILRKAPSPDLQDKLRRVCWMVCWVIFYRFTPVPLHIVRRCLLRAFGAKVGKKVHPYPSARIWAPWNLSLADGSCLAAGVDCYSAGMVTVGAGSVVSQRAYLCAASHDIRSADFPLMLGDITIGPGAWVATEAYIGPGVTIGANAVVGARAVVTRDVQSSTVVAGNPAVIVATR